MARRTGTALLLLAIIVPAIVLGGVFYFILIGAFLVVSAWEFSQMFRSAGYQPSVALVVGGTLVLAAARAFWPAPAGPFLAILVLLAMTIHVFAYERGRNEAALDFVITTAGLTYFGWVGGYFFDLRALPDGGWWVMFVLPIVWLADSGAYSFGARYGKHKMTPRLSPGKSWEGFGAGVFAGTLYGGFFSYAYSTYGPLHVSIWQGLLLGLMLSSLTILGDLGESLIKRFAGAKDSGNIFPGHGGAFDRIDSLIWAAALGVFWIRLFLI